MCWQIALPLITQAAGTAVQQNAENSAARERDRIAADTMRRNADTNRAAGARVSDEVQQIAKSNPQAEQQKAQADFMDALQKAQVAKGGTAFNAPGGDRYQDDLNLARTAAGNEGKVMANRQARIDAPGFQRTAENVGITNTGTDLSLLQNRAGGQDFLDQLRMAQVQADPAQMAAGSFLSAAGSAYGSRYRPPTTPTQAFAPPARRVITKPGLYDTLPGNGGIYNG